MSAIVSFLGVVVLLLLLLLLLLVAGLLSNCCSVGGGGAGRPSMMLSGAVEGGVDRGVFGSPPLGVVKGVVLFVEHSLVCELVIVRRLGLRAALVDLEFESELFSL